MFGKSVLQFNRASDRNKRASKKFQSRMRVRDNQYVFDRVFAGSLKG